MCKGLLTGPAAQTFHFYNFKSGSYAHIYTHMDIVQYDIVIYIYI